MIINGHLDISSQAIYLQSLVIPVSPKKGYFISFCLLALAQWSFLNKKKSSDRFNTQRHKSTSSTILQPDGQNYPQKLTLKCGQSKSRQ